MDILQVIVSSKIKKVVSYAVVLIVKRGCALIRERHRKSIIVPSLIYKRPAVIVYRDKHVTKIMLVIK